MTAQILQISAAEYHAIKAVSNSGITKLMDETPAHFQYWLDNPDPQSESMLVGSVFHCLGLEPDEFANRYHRMEYSRTTKAGKAEEAAATAAGLEILTASQYGLAKALADAALSDRWIGCLLTSPTARKEVSVFWTENVDGISIPCKARLDYMDEIRNFGLLVMDLKSSKTAHPLKLRRVIRERGYHRQAWWYRRGLQQVGLEPRKHLLAVVEKTPPYIVTPANIDGEAMERGEYECLKALSIYAQCARNDYWPGYTDKIIDIGLEPWAYRKDTDNDAEFAG